LFSPKFEHRRAGILLHPTSLPNSDSYGSLGCHAHKFIDFLANSGLSVWQMLPIGPTGLGNSPYQLSSIHAGNPRLIDWEWQHPVTEQDKLSLLSQEWLKFHATASQERQIEWQKFTNQNWLEDYALFQALHQEFNLAWWEWPQSLRDRESATIAAAQNKLAHTIEILKFEQFIFFTQWQKLRNYAHSKNILLFGDMPFFVAHDSAEVWAKRQYFDLNPNGTLRVVAGVPPDYFSTTGQRWGNPLYLWNTISADNFSFWIDRINSQLALFDLIRIDHFRGFEAYWEIPAQEQNAVRGQWIKVDGDALFTKLHAVFGTLPLVAEDLGTITPEVIALRQRYLLPGMKILQFAFSGGADNPYLPFNHTIDSVVYTGTHDNDTTLGWYQTLDQSTQHVVNEFLGYPQEPMPWPLIRAALNSITKLAIIPMQDFLALDSTHRMNLPGTIEGNWKWQFNWESISPHLAEKIRHMINIYGRSV
jgi:4-alpha-glucanotransferase